MITESEVTTFEIKLLERETGKTLWKATCTTTTGDFAGENKLFTQ